VDNPEPAWLQTFIFTGDTVRGIREAQGWNIPYRMYSKVFQAGDVALGGQGAPNSDGMTYFVIVKSRVKPDITKVEEPPVNLEFMEGLFVSPNPFNPQIKVSVQLGNNGTLSGNGIAVSIYNLQGKKIAHLGLAGKTAGGHSSRYDYVWTVTNQTSGIYVVRVIAGSRQWQKKITLLK
jgi:hypothetical protein